MMQFTEDEQQLLDQAGLNLNSGGYVEAVKIYNSLMQQSENQSLLVFRCGLAEYRAGNRASGSEKMARAYEMSDPSTWGALYEGAVFTVAACDDYLTAKELFVRATHECPQLDPTQYLSHAIQHCIEHQFDDEAMDLTRQYIELHPDDFRGWLWRGIAQQYTGFIDRAVASYEKSTKLSPKSGDAWEMLALLAFDTDNRPLLNEALSNARKYSEELSLAILLFKVGEFQESANLYRNLRNDSRDVDFLIYMAFCLFGNGDFVEAMEAVESALRFSPEDHSCLYIKLRSHLCLGQVDLALQVANRMLELFPGESRTSSELARLYYWIQDFETSLCHVDKAMTLSNATVDLHSLRASVLMRLGRKDDALSECRTALAVNRDCWSALVAMAQILCDDASSTEAEIDEASRCMERVKRTLCLKKDLRLFAALRAEACVLERRGRYSEAVVLQRSVVKAPHAPPWLKKIDEARLEKMMKTEQDRR